MMVEIKQRSLRDYLAQLRVVYRVKKSNPLKKIKTNQKDCLEKLKIYSKRKKSPHP